MSDIETVRVQVRQLKGNLVLDARAAVITKALDCIEAELDRLREEKTQDRTYIYELKAELERLRKELEAGKRLVNEMDLRMPEQATEDEDGWITSYRIPVGPWHRLLGWARGGMPRVTDAERAEARRVREEVSKQTGT